MTELDQALQEALQGETPVPPGLLIATKNAMATAKKREGWLFWLCGTLAILEAALLIVMPRWPVLWLCWWLRLPGWVGMMILWGSLVALWSWTLILGAVVPLAVWQRRNMKINIIEE